jgi:hypothetical protein
MQNKEKKKLEDFSLPQLNTLLKHLRLGYDHLKMLLTPKQMKELFIWYDLEENKKKQIAADRIETLGNMSLIINTILTSTFGAWMGLSGCLGCALGSFKMLTFISMLAFFVSGLIGYMSLRMTKDQAQHAIRNQILHHFQLRVLQMINQKMQEKHSSVAFYLQTAAFILENQKDSETNKNSLNLFMNSAEAYEWYEKLIQVLNLRLEEVSDAATAEIYRNQIQRISFQIKKTIAKHFHFLESLALAKKREKTRFQILHTLPFLKILTTPFFEVSKYQASTSSWFKNNFNQLFLGIIPTVWGGFASMFVFVGGIPNIIGELQLSWLHSLLTTPFARLVEISCAALVTCYFAFAFLYSHRKSWQRQELLESTQQNIATEETLLLENNHKLDMLYKVKMHTQKLVSNFTVVKKIDQNLMNQESAMINQ